MGEEKPEEELMGKRKSSPRFDSISRRRHPYHCLYILKYTFAAIFFWNAFISMLPGFVVG